MRRRWLDGFQQDLAYATRAFARSPAFITVVILTLALGIGATTAMFSVVDAVLLNPLPFPNAGRLVVIWQKSVRDPASPPFFDNYRDFEAWQRATRSFEHLTPATWATGGQILTGAGRAREIFAMPVGIDFFPMLGIAPELGRVFEPDDLRRDCTVVLKHFFWMSTFGGGSNIIGRRVELNHRACTVVGIMPPAFTFYPDAAELWILLTPASDIVRNPKAPVGVFALLKPRVSIERAEQEVRSIYRAEPSHDTGGMERLPFLAPLAEQFAYLTGPTLRLTVEILFGAVSFVLLIGCLNIANLLLGKSIARRKEMAVRAALGSGRARLIRQLLTESLLLAGAGAAIGVLLALAAVHYFRTLKPIPMPPGNAVAVNLPVLAFTASIAVLTALFFGLIPALKASRVDLMDALRVSSQTASQGRATRTLRSVLVISEVALSLALLAGAGLLIQSVERLASVPLGFRTEGLVSMSITLPKWSYPNADQRARFYQSVLDRIALLPEVASAALASSLPPDQRFGANPLAVDGRPEPRPETAAFDVGQVFISPDYFRVAGVPLDSGRVFESRDVANAPLVAIVNQALAREYFPHQDPIGRRVRIGALGADHPWLTIVGVVAGEKVHNFFHQMNWEDNPMVFRPVNQDPPGGLSLVLRTPAAVAALSLAIQKQIAALDRDVPTGDVQTMTERLSRTLSYPRLRAVILASFAALALLLAAIGLYAVLSQLTAQRTREFGVRMALGAQRRDLLKLVILEGMLLTCAGLAAGLVIALSLTGLLRGLLYGVKATDPLTLAAGAALLALVALLAAYLPARRASRVDPMAALRYE